MAKSADKQLHVELIVDAKTKQLDKLFKQINSMESKVKRNVSAQDAVTKAVDRTNAAYKKSSSLVSGLTSKIKRLAATYLGVMGARAAITTSDTITSTENKLNALNNGDTAATQRSLDNIYAVSQNARIGYADTMANVSKLMTLAGDAFNNNINNAIRFQEIMGKTYALGGASAAEQASSMYQLVQALGSGVLQGDELRSVREGAPIAYKKIEEFAQGVFDTEESLKELASQGRITSDIVVAAMMDAGDGIDKAFEKTEQTFAQTWTKIKNTAVKAFEPVLQKLNDMLNSQTGQQIITGISNAIIFTAKACEFLLEKIESIYNFISDNWEKIDTYFYATASVIGVILVAQIIKAIGATLGWATASIGAAIASGAAWASANFPLVVLIGTIALAIAWVSKLGKNSEKFGETVEKVLTGIAFLSAGVMAGMVAKAFITKTAITGMIFDTALFAKIMFLGVFSVLILVLNKTMDGFKTAAEVIGAICLALAISIMIYAAIATAGVTLVISLIIGAVVALIGAILLWGEQICSTIAGIVSVIRNIFVTLITFIFQVFILPFAYAFDFLADFLGNVFNDPVGACYHLFENLVNGILGLLKTLASGIDAIFGTNLADEVQGWMNDVSGWAEAGAARYGNGTYEQQSGAVEELTNMMNDAVNSFTWDTSLAISQGAAVGRIPAQWLNEHLDSLTERLDLESLIDELESQSPDLSQFDTNLDTNIDDVIDAENATADNTGNIADAMELAAEDLEYLRKVAEMEWKKEFTTASITVNMNNNNNINGDSDLDGIVTKLSSMLYEELGAVANGVYA